MVRAAGALAALALAACAEVPADSVRDGLAVGPPPFHCKTLKEAYDATLDVFWAEEVPFPADFVTWFNSIPPESEYIADRVIVIARPASVEFLLVSGHCVLFEGVMKWNNLVHFVGRGV